MSVNKFEKLFEEGKIGKLSIKNRTAMAPMMQLGKLIEPGGRISKQGIEYYAERAKGEVGLIITGACVPSLDIEAGMLKRLGMAPLLPLFRADTPIVIPRLKELADVVHKYGTKIAIQLTPGAGRNINLYPLPIYRLLLLPAIPESIRDRVDRLMDPIYHRIIIPMVFKMAGLPVGPSALTDTWDHLELTQRELATEEVEGLAKSFGTAAKIIKEAGIDGVELHGHEGYLMDQFMTSLWNKRTDKYGGDLDGRLRLVYDIIKSIREEVGKDFPIIFRYAAKHYIEGGRDIEESLEIARRLEKAGVDAFHVDAGCYDDWYWPHPPGYQPPGCMVDMAEAVKKVVNIPVIAVGRMGYPELAEKVLREGKADFVALGRPLLADPEWPLKAKEGRVEDIRYCIGCHDACLLNGIIKGVGYMPACAVNPACGNEKELTIKPAEKKKTVVIAGGGAAGMEAARVAALRGHDVTLCEKSDNLGGHLIAGSVPAFKRDLELLRDYYATQIRKLGVSVELGKEATPEVIEKLKPDVLVVATGSTPIIPDVPGIDKEKVITAIDALLGKKEVGETVVVIGGGLVGCETAVYLAQNGKGVTVVEMLDEIISDMVEANRQYLFKMLAESGVNVLTNTPLSRVTDDGVTVTNKVQRYEAELNADTVVLALGLEPERGLIATLRGKAQEFYIIGDCEKPANVMDAVWSAFNTMRVV